MPPNSGEVKRRMRQIIDTLLIIVVSAVISMIGAGMISLAYSIVAGIAGANSTMLGTAFTSSGTSITTMTSLMPLLALAMMGGIALGALLNYIGFFGRRE
ncbi:Uncharacterised protein [Candidatus Anstonella stagnisolia]|nr:Uncharacterised protein [Candidatus Anstonella stagnisolia]